MSKAFAPGESADDEERTALKLPVLPPGAPNYITPGGIRKLQSRLAYLSQEKAALTDSVDDQQRKKTIDWEATALVERINTARVIDPVQQAKDRVLFGAHVTVRDATGQTRVWRIVGVDETDLDNGWISWISPLARALLEKQVGQTAEFNQQRLTIQHISY